MSLFLGDPIYVAEIDEFITQPTMREIIRNEHVIMPILEKMTMSDKQIKTIKELESVDSYTIALLLLNEDQAETAFGLPIFMSMIFPEYEILDITENGIILKNQKGKVVILNQVNFDIFKRTLRDIFNMKDNQKKEEFNPKSEKAKEIAEKLKKARQRKLASTKGVAAQTMADFATILTISLNGYTLEQVLDLTMYQFFILLERVTLYNNFSIDLKCRLAGASDGDEPVDWMKNLVD